MIYLAILLASGSAFADGEWTGEIKPEYRYYMESALTTTQTTATVDSFYHQLAKQGINPATLPPPVPPGPPVPGQNEPTLALTLNYQRTVDADTRFSFKGFARYDEMDPARSHADLRELVWTYRLSQADQPVWDLRVGVDKVFWGTTESNHLIDIVNSTDAVENIDSSEKLGQPMVRLTTHRDFGNLDFLLLPYFRTPTASGAQGRLRPPTPMTEVPVRYNRALGDTFPSWVVRWSHRIGKADLGGYYFQGINRDPRVTQSNAVITATNPYGLIAHYDWMRQWGFDGSYLLGDFTLKGEYLLRFTQGSHFRAAVGGVEYTFGSLFGTDWDLNLVFERNVDNRGENSAAILQNDNFYGIRLAFNDAQSTQLKVGYMRDLFDDSKSMRIEASRRLTDNVTLRLETQLFQDIATSNPLYIISQDSYVQLSAIYYF
jgi:hypothetical protein